MEETILRKKAKWVIENKMKMSGDEDIRESSIEIFPDRYLVMAVLKNNNKRKVVTKDQDLAYEILSALSSMQGSR